MTLDAKRDELQDDGWPIGSRRLMITSSGYPILACSVCLVDFLNDADDPEDDEAIGYAVTIIYGAAVCLVHVDTAIARAR